MSLSVSCMLFILVHFCFCSIRKADAKMYGDRLQEITSHGQLTWRPKHNNVFRNRDEMEIKRFMGISNERRMSALQTGGKPKHTLRTPTTGHMGRGQFGSGRGRWKDTSRYQSNYWEQGSNRRGFGGWDDNGHWNWDGHGQQGGGGGGGGWHGNEYEHHQHQNGGAGPRNNNGGWHGNEQEHHEHHNGGGGSWNGDHRGEGNGEFNGGGRQGGFERGAFDGKHFHHEEGNNGGDGGEHGFGHEHNEHHEFDHHGRLKRGVRLPKNFDWRDYTDCQSLDDIRYQQCGDCWSVASASAMSDRYCLWTHQNKIFSARQITTCAYPNKGGCHGGFPKDAMKLYTSKGVASGGDPKIKDEQKGCLPYPLELGNKAKCPTACDDNSTMDSTTGDYYEITSKNVTEIMEEIYGYGPVVATFELFDDFTYFGDGVYQHVSGASQGYHAIRVIGWGEENGTPYWLAANSWGIEFGDKGYFKILRGKNHCNIESWVTCVYPAEAYR